jgi:hypothetical protein
MRTRPITQEQTQTSLSSSVEPSVATSSIPSPSSTLVSIKYLKLKLARALFVDDGRLGHITFAYFGDVKVDPIMLTRIFQSIRGPFWLVHPKKEQVGKNLDIPAICFSIQGVVTFPNALPYPAEVWINAIRECVLRLAQVEDRNYIPYKPHVSELTKEPEEAIQVIGIESNDGTWYHLFSTQEETEL